MANFCCKVKKKLQSFVVMNVTRKHYSQQCFYNGYLVHQGLWHQRAFVSNAPGYTKDEVWPLGVSAMSSLQCFDTGDRKGI